MPSSLLVVGTLAFDTIETPFGKAPKILGGSGNYFALASSLFSPVRLVGVVGEDFPESHLEELKKRRVDLAGVTRLAGKTFHWSGKYGSELHEAETLATHLNVLETFDPELPESFRDSQYVFLGNLSPVIQQKVMKQTSAPKLVALDTMNYWIASQREELINTIKKVNLVIINEGEARLLAKSHSIVEVAKTIMSWGPQRLVIKRGEYGALLFDRNEFFSIPGLPLHDVKDPTGAGDSFAGGFMGYLASRAGDWTNPDELRRAVVMGCVVASFTVQDFGPAALMSCTPQKLQERFEAFVRLTHFPKEGKIS